jgi:hypothetical protein
LAVEATLVVLVVSSHLLCISRDGSALAGLEAGGGVLLRNVLTVVRHEHGADRAIGTVGAEWKLGSIRWAARVRLTIVAQCRETSEDVELV